MKPSVSIVIASRNETAMLVVTVLSAIEALKSIGGGEIVVVENSENPVHNAVLDLLAGPIKDKWVRVIRQKEPSLALAIHQAHEAATNDLIFYTDAHTIIGSDTLPKLVNFFERHANEPIGFVHAPIQWAHRSRATRKTHMSVDACCLGDWSGAEPVETERRVTWKGMPYMIRRETWKAIGGLGCCAEHRLGWGVLAYIGIKPWLFGFENWAIPDGVVYHLGEWPDSAKAHINYRVYDDGGLKPGLGKAVALYAFGGETLLRREFSSCKLERYFASVDDAVQSAATVAAKEHALMAEKQTIAFDDLIKSKPWDNLDTPLISESYRRLNAQLHSDTNVKYGYKGHQQADEVQRLAKERGCADILDYGAGKRTLEAAMKERGTNIRSYDPAIDEIAGEPEPADLVVCSDVLEHIEPSKLQAVVAHLRKVTRQWLFLRVCTVPCTSKTLPDGSDPHRIVKPLHWWRDALFPHFRIQSSISRDDQYFTVICRPL